MHPPGSFSKNFAWHGTGLKKLHEAIQFGFGGKLNEISREEFRGNCGIDDASLQLIPVNFFLYNRISQSQNFVAIDELVYMALTTSHSLRFDRLSLFSLHLSVGGERAGVNAGISKPALWIKDYVRYELWRDGWWQRAKLDIPNMDSFFNTVLDAEQDVRVKCRSNYRHLFSLCEYLDGTEKDIDTGADKWIGSAYFLAWDRYLMDQSQDQGQQDELIKYARDSELYKLLGLPEDYVEEYVNEIVKNYIDAGCLSRFKAQSIKLSKKIIFRNPQGAEVEIESAPIAAVNLEALQEERREVIERKTKAYEAQIRDAKLALRIKQLYNFKCMFCGEKLQVGISPDSFYIEGAHIKGVGKPHNGPDSADNLLALCPNHHKQFDRGVLYLERISVSELKIVSLVPSHSLHQQSVQLVQNHSISDEFLEWHRKFCLSQNR